MRIEELKKGRMGEGEKGRKWRPADPLALSECLFVNSIFLSTFGMQCTLEKLKIS